MTKLPPGETVWLGKSRTEDILSVGLVIEPEFFVNYYFSDREGTQLIGYTRADRALHPVSTTFTGVEPAFGVVLEPDFTLIPPALFVESECVDYLSFTTFSGKEAQVMHERLIRSDIYLVSREDPDALAYAAGLHPGLALRHGAGVLIEAATAHQALLGGERMYLHQAGKLYTLAVFRDKQLLLAQNLQSKYLEDVRYYVLYAHKLLEIKQDSPLHLLGEAPENIPLAEALGNRLPNTKAGIESTAALEGGVDPKEYTRHFIALTAVQ